MLFDRLANGIEKHPKLIIVAWVVILLVMAVFAIRAPDVLIYDVNEMAPTDSESVEGFMVLLEEFPQSSVDTDKFPVLVIYFEDKAGLDKANILLLELNMDAMSNPDIVSFSSMNPMITEKGDGIILALVTLKEGVNPLLYTPELRDFIDESKKACGFDGVECVVGTSAIGYDMQNNSVEDMKRIDPFTVLLILVLIGLFFRSIVASATPPIVIGFAFVAVMGLIFFIGQAMQIFYITNVMILVCMMGAGCDYCIFIIARYREERRSGLDHDDALHQAIVWAGESIAISGASVVIGFGVISVCDYSMVSSMGICLALGVLLALLAALTLIPAILALIGDKVLWPSKMEDFQEGGKASKGWYAWFSKKGTKYFEESSRFSMKHAKAIAVVAILITVPAVYAMTQAEDSYDMISAMLSGESREGMELIGEYADQGLVMPNYTIIEYKEPIANVKYTGVDTENALYWTDYWKDRVAGSLPEYYNKVLEDDNVATINEPFVWQAYVDETKDITNPSERLQHIRSELTMFSAMLFNAMTKVVGMMLPDLNMLFDGFGAYIDQSVQPMIPGFSWDDEVAEIKASGVSEPSEVISKIEEKYPELTSVINAIKGMGATDVILVDGFGPVIDYQMNINLGLVGGDYIKDGKIGSGDARYMKINSSTIESAMSPRSMQSIEYIGEVFTEYEEKNKNVVVDEWDTGTAVLMYDASKIVKSQFTLIEILVVVMIILMLFFVMRSYLIPIRSVLTILMSISWTLAITHFVFTVLLGEDVLWLVPVLLMVICLGLGMDYDILLTTRIKENVMSLGMSNDDAIHHAVVHTGSIITICGLIMGGALGTLMLSSMPLLREIGFALCFAILVDALIVRTYIVPAIMHLLGDWNWKGPGSKKKQKEVDG